MADGSTGGSAKPTRRQLARLKKADAMVTAPRTSSCSPQIFDIFDPTDFEDRPGGCHSASTDLGLASRAAEPLLSGQVAYAQGQADSNTHSGVSAPLVSGSSTAGMATQYISIDQLMQSINVLPRFVPMAVQLPQAQEQLSADASEPGSELQAESELSDTRDASYTQSEEVGLLRSELSDARDASHAQSEEVGLLRSELFGARDATYAQSEEVGHLRSELSAARDASAAQSEEFGLLRTELSCARDASLAQSSEIRRLHSELSDMTVLRSALEKHSAELVAANGAAASMRGDLQRSQIRYNLSARRMEDFEKAASHEQAECTLFRHKFAYEAAMHKAADDDLVSTRQLLEISRARTALWEQQFDVCKSELAQSSQP